MISLYQIGIALYGFVASFASIFNSKAKLWKEGQKHIFKNLPSNSKSEIVWVHCASLGEYEQAIPLLQKIKEWKSDYSILVTFFSPSGYLHANPDFFDFKSYLPLDTKRNCQQFLNQVNPKVAIFIKNEFWPNFLNELHKRNIPTLSASSTFRKDQLIFKFYGKWLLQILKNITHFYVQNETSQYLLRDVGFNNSTICGDTRFDRVLNNLKDKKSIPYIEEFKSNKKLVVCGSTYEVDSKMITEISSRNPDLKFIIAPHEIDLSKKLKPFGLLYSEIEREKISENSILIIDSIGILSQLYQYADIAYVGGGFGHNGLHNILEPLAFNIPIIIGPNYHKHSEAVEAIDVGIANSIHNTADFEGVIKEKLSLANDKTSVSKFCLKRSGATEIIFEGIKTHL